MTGPLFLGRLKKGKKKKRTPAPSFPGLCALSVNHGNSFLAYPGSATLGEITVYDANNLVSPHFSAILKSDIAARDCADSVIVRLPF